MRILFITWDGPQVAYLESLFLPIFSALRDHGYYFDVLQFRWGSHQQQAAVHDECARLGIGYRAVTVWRRGGAFGPLASAVTGALQLRKAIRHFGSDILMPRSIFPSLTTLVANGPAIRPVLMDADGFELDERVEGGQLRSTGLAYRLLRDIEAQMVRRSQAVLVRTPASHEILLARAGPPVERERFHVVTNGRDQNVFRPFDASTRAAVRASLDIPQNAPLIVYVGSIGTRYRTQSIGEFALHLRKCRPDTRLLILTGFPDDARAELTSQSPELAALTTILRVPPDEVARYVAAGDVGTAFIRSTFSTYGIAPVKVGEYLLCGVPVFGAAQIGLNKDAVAAGVFCDEQIGMEEAARWVADTIIPKREMFRDIARQAGLQSFSLERSVSDYLGALKDCRARIADASKAVGSTAGMEVKEGAKE